jgi:uncharacterized protein (TIGR02270 family)
MAKERATLIVDILEENYEELEFLWGQRRTALRNPFYSLRAFLDLEERIEAHVQGLLVAEHQLVPLLQDKLGGDDANMVFAAAYPLLRLNQDEAALLVWGPFEKAEGPKRLGLSEALIHGATDALLPRLQQALAGAAPLAVAAAEVLAFKSPGALRASQIDPLVKHDEPAIRAAAWRVIARGKTVRPRDAYQAGLNDPDAQVQAEALWAAAWNAQAWILDGCRKSALKPEKKSWPSLQLLAIVGQPFDAGLIERAGRVADLGPRRFQLLGAFGHPDLVELLLAGLESKDPLTAVAAGQAFSKITGQDVESNQRVTVPPPDGKEPDEFEKEFLDEVKLPDVERARAHWKKTEAQFRQGTRWSRGLNLSKGVTPEILMQLDLESRFEACLRGKFEGSWQGGLSDLEAFPHKRS